MGLLMILIVFSCFFISFVRTWKNGKWIVSSYIIAVYAFSIFCSIFLFQSKPQNFEVTIFPSMVFCLSFYFLLEPFNIHTPTIACNQNLYFDRIFCRTGYFISGLLLLGAICLFTKIREAFGIGLADVREAMYKNEVLVTSYTPIEHLGHSILRWLSGLAYSLLIMAFYSLIYVKGKILLKVMLFISSLSAAYLGIMDGGRTYLIYWLLFLGFCCCLFWKLLSKSYRRYLSISLSIILSIVVFYFFVVTFARVSISGDNISTENFLLFYVATPFPTFCDFFNSVEWHPYTLSRLFPITSSIFDGPFDLNDYRYLIMRNTGKNIGVFYTLLGDIFVDVGIFGLIIYVIIARHFLNRIVRKQRFYLSDLLLLGIGAQVILHGLFYYSLYRVEQMVCVIIICVASYYLKVRYKN